MVSLLLRTFSLSREVVDYVGGEGVKLPSSKGSNEKATIETLESRFASSLGHATKRIGARTRNITLFLATPPH